MNTTPIHKDGCLGNHDHRDCTCGVTQPPAETTVVFTSGYHFRATLRGRQVIGLESKRISSEEWKPDTLPLHEEEMMEMELECFRLKHALTEAEARTRFAAEVGWMNAEGKRVL